MVSAQQKKVRKVISMPPDKSLCGLNVSNLPKLKLTGNNSKHTLF